MLAELRRRVPPVLPLPIVQRHRATVTSVAGHGALATLVAFVGVGSGPPAPESPLIMAELVTALAPLSPSPAPPGEPAADDEPRSETVAQQPTPPAPSEPEVDAPMPEAEPPDAELTPESEPPAQPQPRPVPPRERTVEPLPADPPPLERVAEGPPPEPPAVPPAPTEPATPSPPVVPSRVLASHEERSVRSQLSSWTGSFSADEPEPTLTWRDDGQEYRAVLKRQPATDAMGMEQLAVELTTERDGERLVTELRMSRLAFSNFGQFVNRWDPNVGLNDDVIDGRFHSNTELTISRQGRKTPVFLGKVTIAGNGFVTSGPGFLSKSKLFPAGIETRTRRIALPERAATLDAIAGPDNSQRFARNAALTFHADGTVSWRELDGGSAEPRRSLGDEPFYLLADDDVELEVSGTVNGKVLVYTPERIVITGHLRYAVDPRAPNADDYLGLVAERSVEIAEPGVTGLGDLEIFASIYARQRFVVRSFQSRRSGTLIVHGSLTAGTLSASEPRFATRVEFDHRLTTMRAPSFPLSDRYELDSTTDEWRVVGTAN